MNHPQIVVSIRVAAVAMFAISNVACSAARGDANPAATGNGPAVTVQRNDETRAGLYEILRSVIGAKSDDAILAAMNKISPGPNLIDGKPWFDMDPSFRVLDFDIGNNGSDAMLASALGKLPVGILYVARGDRGKGPALIKLTFLRDGSAKSVMSLLTAITGTPAAQLKFSTLSKQGKSKVRMVTGSKFVVYAVGWQSDPKASCAQLVICTRKENMAFVSIS